MFNEIDEVIDGFPDGLISRYKYLSCSGRPEAKQVRNFVDKAFSRYPDKEQKKLKSRFTLIDDYAHLSAFFEPFLHEIMISTGFKIIEIEPKLAWTSKSPDFLIESSAGNRFYLEAKLVTGRTDADERAQKRLEEAVKRIEEVSSDKYFYVLEPIGLPSSMIQGRKLKNKFRRWLENQNHEDVIRKCNENDPPKFTHNECECTLIISLVPKQIAYQRRAEERSIGCRVLGPIWVTPHIAIRDAIKEKANRYGDLDLPYVVAVNTFDDHADEESAVNAMLGSPCVIIRGDSYQMSREFDGAWRGPNGIENTRVSAIISTERLDPWSFGDRRARIIHNPWAAKPLPDLNIAFDSIQFPTGRELIKRRSDLLTCLGLPRGWPKVGITTLD